MPFAAKADKVVLSPSQIVTSLPASTEGCGFTTIVTSSVSLQPLSSVTVTMYVVVIKGETVLFCPSPSPLFQIKL